MTTPTHAYCPKCKEDVLLDGSDCLFCGRRLKVSGRGHRPRTTGAHREAAAQRQVELATADPQVSELRAELGTDYPVDRATVAEWLETEAAKSPRLPDGVSYFLPGDTWVRWIPSTAGLEPLRRLSETLAKRYHWWPAEATVWILTDAILPLGGVSIRVTRTLELGPYAENRPRVTVSDWLAGDAELMAKAKRKAQGEWDIGPQGDGRQAASDQRLLAFVEEHGRGEKWRIPWNKAAKKRGDLTYKDRQAFYKAVARVRAATGTAA